MKNEYKDAMEQLTLSEEAKSRILSNVLDAGANADPQEPEPVTKVSKFSPKEYGIIAAACLVIVASALFIRTQFLGDLQTGGKNPGTTAGTGEPVEWVTLASVDDIAKETDCKTYTLDNLPEKYEVDQVEVANEQRHVRITYKEEKSDKNDKAKESESSANTEDVHNTLDDTVVFEYKEQDDDQVIKAKFDSEKEITTESMDEKEITLYGDDKCDGITWEEDSISFGVTMSEPISKAKARKLVTGTTEKKKSVKSSKKTSKKTTKVNKNAVGWDKAEKGMTEQEKDKILAQIMDTLGFKVVVKSPAEKVTYKFVDDYESFAFTFPKDYVLEGLNVIGYAGREEGPEQAMDGYREKHDITVNDIDVTVYERKHHEKLFSCQYKEIFFIFFVDDCDTATEGAAMEDILNVLSVKQNSDTADDDTDSDNTSSKDNEKANTAKEETKKALTSQIKEIQSAVKAYDMDSLCDYMDFPVFIKDQGYVKSKEELLAIPKEGIMTVNWVETINTYDPDALNVSAKSIYLGDSSMYLKCKIKGEKISIVEIGLDSDNEYEDSNLLEPSTEE